MKFRVLYIFILLILSGIFFLVCKDNATSASSKVEWLSFNKGIKTAQKTRKPIIVDFYADWCYWCKKMDADLFNDPKIIKKLAEEFVTIRVHTDKSQKINYHNKVFSPKELSVYFGIKGLPTIAFLDYNGKPITKLPGYITSDVFIPVLNYIREECYLKKIKFDDYVNKRASCKKK